jgi:hypothetical protein
MAEEEDPIGVSCVPVGRGVGCAELDAGRWTLDAGRRDGADTDYT